MGRLKARELLRCIPPAGLLLCLLLAADPRRAEAAPVESASPYDLIAAVNSLRSGSGVAELAPNGALMAAAQAHSEFQAALGSWSHTGAGGTNETDRAIAAGYGGGLSVVCDEAVAVANPSQGADYIVNVIWNDYVHREVVLRNPRYVDVGAGAAEKDGLVYYTVDVCSTGSGTAATRPAGPAAPAGPTRTPEVILAVQTSAGEGDGSIFHVVQAGQTLWTIADAYGLSVEQLALQNNLSLKNPTIYIGQKLRIRDAFTPTLSPTITQTPRPPTRTPRPTFTPRPTQPTATITATPTATRRPLVALPRVGTHTIGILLVALCGLGLLVVVLGNLSTTRQARGARKGGGDESPGEGG